MTVYHKKTEKSKLVVQQAREEPRHKDKVDNC